MVFAERGIQNSEISKMLVGIQKSFEGSGRRGALEKGDEGGGNKPGMEEC